MMSDILNVRCSVFIAFGGGEGGGYLFVSIHCILLCFLPCLFMFCLFRCLFLLSRTPYIVYGLPKGVTGPLWTELIGNLRSYDGNCNENVTLKYNFALG